MAPDDITLYFWPTPNGQKIVIMLEELGEPYLVHYIDINSGAQHEPAYLAISAEQSHSRNRRSGWSGRQCFVAV